MVSIEEVKKYPRIKDIVSWTVFGYLIGVLITFLVYQFVLEDAVMNLSTSKWITAALLFLFALCLCYSRSVRCTVTLAIPILCSSKGRSLIVAFTFVLVATGPTKNIIDNVEVLTTSMSCGQTQLKEALGRILDVMKRPIVAIKDAIAATMSEIRSVMKRVQVVLLRIKELVMVVSGIRNAFAWLGSIISVCNKEFGTPFDRCMRIADDAIKDCRSKLGPIKGLCKVTHLFSMLCYTVKFIDVICVLVEFFNDAIIQTVMERLHQFAEEVKNMFDVSVTFDHDFYFSTVASKDMEEVSAEIMQDLRSKMNTFFLVFGWLDILGSILFLTVIIKALYFKSKYLRNLSFNNNYLTNEFNQIDEVRRKNDQELALPLTSLEENKYVWLSGCRLTRSELFKIARSMLFLTITNVQIFCICFADYSLYWLLAMITYYGRKEAGLEVPPFITVDVKGGGFVGDIFHGIVRAFEPLNENYTIDATSCLPIPKQPSKRRYWQIAGLCILAWIFLLLQPYGLRLRHVVMRKYYPDVARARATWLYTEILLKRVTFFKLARRKARSMIFKSGTQDDFSCLDWIRAKTDRFWIFRLIFGHRKGDYCIICSKPVKEDKIKCETLGCKGIYCENCYRESNNNCCVCKNPIDYGDLSDISEVKDSSDDLDEIHIQESEKLCS